MFQIVIYKVGRKCPVTDEPPPVPPDGADSIYSLETLPPEHWKKYIYASRFISLVRAKTPKIILYTSEAKFLLMENSPNPDIEAVFYAGNQILKNILLRYIYIYIRPVLIKHVLIYKLSIFFTNHSD